MDLPIEHNGRLSMKCTFRTDDFRNSGDGEGFDFYTFILVFLYYINICLLIDIYVYISMVEFFILYRCQIS